MPHLLILFPGALGDFLCLWPTLQSLRIRCSGRLTVVARSEVACLLPPDDFEFISIDRREIADLFATGQLAEATCLLLTGFDQVHSWTGFGNPDFIGRLELVTGGSVSVHAFRGMRPGEHASAYFGRCAGVAPGNGRLGIAAAARVWAERFWSERFAQQLVLVVHPGSGSPRKNWEGMAAVAQWWRRRRAGAVLTLAGPAEKAGAIAGLGDARVHTAPLDRLAALLSRAAAYLGNDSGISHLAGLAGARGVVLFGPSDPATWHPLGGGLRILSAPSPCAACGPDRFCTHRLSSARVQRALDSLDS